MATAAVLHSQAPSRDEIARDIRQHLPAMYLFQDCPEWLGMEIFGRTQWLPPYNKDLRLVPHPVLRNIHPDTKADMGPLMVQANGRLAVRDTYGIRRDPRSNKALSVALLEGQNAADIVIFACENYGERGVVWLRGDESDADRMDKSRKLFMRHIRAWAEQERGARAEAVAKFLALPANKGRVPPPPTKNQIRAQEVLDSQDSRERTAAHICTVAYDWEGDDWDTYARHMKAAHQMTVTKKRDETLEPEPGTVIGTPIDTSALENGGGESDPNAQVLGQPVLPEQTDAAQRTKLEHQAKHRGEDPAAAERPRPSKPKK